MDAYFWAKSDNGAIRTKGLNSCSLGHKIQGFSGSKEDGIFADWSWDGEKLTVKNDRYGFYPLYYCNYGNEISLSPSISKLIREGAPAELDYPALAVFFRLGFFIGEDTPFKYIKAVPPDACFCWEKGKLTTTGKYAYKDPIDISEEAAIDQYIYLFRQSMKRRLPSGEDWVVPLSGGRDSRHILLELDYLGFKPRAAVTLRPYSFFYDEDINPARLLSDALGVEHILLDPGELKFSDVIRNFELTNYCADEHAFFLPLADYLHGIGAETIYDGIGGDVLSAGYLWTAELADLLRAQSYAKFCEILFRTWLNSDRGTLELTLQKNFYNQVAPDQAIERLTVELKKHAKSHNPLRSFYFWNRTRREVTLVPYSINSAIPKVFSPYLDHDLYDFMMAVPENITADKKFHTKTIERAYPKYANIPYTQPGSGTGMLQKCRAKFTKDFAKYYMKNFMACSRLLRTLYLWPRALKCLINNDYWQTFWWLDPKTMLYLIGLEKLR